MFGRPTSQQYKTRVKGGVAAVIRRHAGATDIALVIVTPNRLIVYITTYTKQGTSTRYIKTNEFTETADTRIQE